MFGVLESDGFFWLNYIILILGKGGDPSITCYSDSDWASNPITRRSIGGHVVYFGTSIVVWTSKTQKGILALSSTESEYIEL